MSTERIVKLVAVSAVCVLASDWASNQPWASKSRVAQLGAKYGAGAAVLLAAGYAGVFNVSVTGP